VIGNDSAGEIYGTHRRFQRGSFGVLGQEISSVKNINLSKKGITSEILFNIRNVTQII
jgi:hypothetical protein